MKTLFITLFVLSLHSFGQGFVIFYNRNLRDPVSNQLYSAPVTLPSGRGVEGQAFTAGLFVMQTGALELIATTTFQQGAGAGLFLPPQGAVEVPGHPPGSSATFVARVWETSAGSYQNAVASGRYFGEFVTKSGASSITIPELGFAEPPGGIPTPTLAGIQPLTLIPEPHTFALAILGGAALILAQKTLPPKTVKTLFLFLLLALDARAQVLVRL